jgi:multiple sugar transport system substrate-binding protein
MQRKSRAARPVFSAVGGALLLASLAGCGGTATTTPQAAPRPFDGATLQVACPTDAVKAVVERYGHDWATRQGVRLETTTYAAPAGPESVAAADLWLIEPASLGRWAAAGRLEPVPDEYTRPQPRADEAGGAKYHWPDLLPLYRERLLRWGDRVYALPVLGEGPVCFYRLDLFADPDHKSAFRARFGRDLAPPATWEDYADLAEFFNGRPGLSPSLPPLTDNDEIDRAFHAVAASCAVRAANLGALRGASDRRAALFSFHCDFATGEPLIASPGFVHALELLQRLQACRVPADGKPGPEAFAAGRTVLCLADASWIDHFEKSPAKPRFGIARVPGSRVVFDHATGQAETPAGGNYVPYLGADGCLGVVPRGAARAEAAVALLAELGGPEKSRQIAIEPRWGGGAFRGGQLSDPAGWSAFGLDQVQTKALLQALEQTLTPASVGNPATRLRLPREAEYRKALLEQVRAALEGKKDAAAALKAAEEQWQALEPADRRRVEYAHSLGLTPP